MKKLNELLKENTALEYIGGCNCEEIVKAEAMLNISFPNSYKDLLMQYGIISFGSHEWCGLNLPGYLNVVETTNNERTNNIKFPKNCFVLENLAIDGLMILVDENESIFEWNGFENKKIYSSLVDYYIDCLK